jgi:hypothetical protein
MDAQEPPKPPTATRARREVGTPNVGIGLAAVRAARRASCGWTRMKVMCLATYPPPGRRETHVLGRRPGSAVSHKKAPVTGKKIPCSERKSSLLWERNSLLILAHETRRTALALPSRGPPRRPLSPFGGCLPGVLILVFSKTCGYSPAPRNFFLFQDHDFVLLCPREGLATFGLAPFSAGDKNLPLFFCLDNLT